MSVRARAVGRPSAPNGLDDPLAYDGRERPIDGDAQQKAPALKNLIVCAEAGVLSCLSCRVALQMAARYVSVGVGLLEPGLANGAQVHRF